MNIHILTVPRSEMRPEVDGADWYWEPNGDLTVKVNPLGNWREEMLLAIHETVEALMCKHNKVSQESVDKYDQEYDKTHSADLNAGDETDAPYRLEHCYATAIERILAGVFNVPWKEYDDRLAKFYPGPSKRETT